MMPIKYFFFLAVVAGIMSGINYFLEEKDHGDDPVQMNATSALMLEYAHEDIEKAYYNTSLVHIERAIIYMESIEQALDPYTADLIKKSIDKLHKIQEGVKKGNLNEEMINRTFVEALNTLALAHLELSEKALTNDKENTAHHALDIAIIQMKSALKFATGDAYRTEEAIYKELAIMAGDHPLDMDHIISLEDSLINLIVLPNTSF